jgi:hypothetical protein
MSMHPQIQKPQCLPIKRGHKKPTHGSLNELVKCLSLRNRREVEGHREKFWYLYALNMEKKLEEVPDLLTKHVTAKWTKIKDVTIK